MTKAFDKSAIASDTPRSRKQYLYRQIAKGFVWLTGLNRVGPLTTEIVQAIHPIRKVSTKWGDMTIHCGHGRLFWRTETYATEEPETIAWMDAMDERDVLWDVGANVGMYSVYAARFRKCKVVAFEPESQNFAILVRNIHINGVQDRCMPANIALANRSEIGKLHVRYLTQGGAYNSFDNSAETAGTVPDSNKAIWQSREVDPITQIMYGAALDDLAAQSGLPLPTHLKIDVDGLEPLIIDGAKELLGNPVLRSVLIEINRNSPKDLQIPDIMASKGFRLQSERSNWLSREDRSREQEMPTTNMIFTRP